MLPFTVFGAFAQSSERYASLFEADSARHAERLAQLETREGGGTLWVCRILPGEQVPADTYTAFCDPRDERNLGIESIEPDVPSVIEPDAEWLVMGFAVPDGLGLSSPEFYRLAERYADLVVAPSPLIAEDAARDRLADKKGELIVCGVVKGRHEAADSYASFAGPDVMVAG